MKIWSHYMETRAHPMEIPREERWVGLNAQVLLFCVTICRTRHPEMIESLQQEGNKFAYLT